MIELMLIIMYLPQWIQLEFKMTSLIPSMIQMYIGQGSNTCLNPVFNIKIRPKKKNPRFLLPYRP